MGKCTNVIYTPVNLHKTKKVVEADVTGAAAIVLAEPILEDARRHWNMAN